MKKFTKLVLAVLLAFAISGCSCSDKECNCPGEQINTNEQQYITINNGYRDLYRQSVQSVVMVRMQRKSNGEIKATGSGIVAIEEGNYAYILTNAHVVKDLTNDFELEVFFSDDEGFMSGKSEIARVMGKDFDEDVAVLEIPKSTKYKLANIGDSSKVEKGDFVYTIGSPYQKFNHTTSGIISNYNVKIEIDMASSGAATPVYAILFDAPINKGNSGGALFDANGKVIGITTLKYDELNGIYGALPINYFMKVAKHLLANGTDYKRPTLNLTILSVNEMGKLKNTYGISASINTGVYVQNSLESGSISNQTVITEINGNKIKSVVEFNVELLKYNIGDTITLTIMDKEGINARNVSVTLHE